MEVIQNEHEAQPALLIIEPTLYNPGYMREKTSIRKALQRWHVVSALGVAAVLGALSNQVQAQNFIGADVGIVNTPGMVATNGDGTMTISGNGSDIWGTSDNFYYFYAPVTGQYWEAVVRVHSLTRPDNWTKVELMVRQADVGFDMPQTGDPHISNMATPPDGQNEIRGQHRYTSYGDSGETAPSPVVRPAYPNQWLKVSRVGAIFYLSHGTDGINWTRYATYDTSSANFAAPFTDPILVGVAVTSHTTDTALANAVISNLKVTVNEGLYIGDLEALPNGFRIQVSDTGASIVNPSTAVLTLNGATVPVTMTSANAGVTTFTHQGTLLPPGSTNTMSIKVNAMNGVPSSATRTFVVPMYKTLTAADALPTASVDKAVSGFKMRVHQRANTGGELPNSDARTEAQLAGEYGENVANTASYVKGFSIVPLINFNNRVNVDPLTIETNGNFGADIAWPGISADYTNNFAAEFYTVLEFPAAGIYGFIVNSDDGFKVTPILAGKDTLAVSNAAGIYQGGRGSADTLFWINVEASGLYAFRLNYEQGGGGADMEFINLDSMGQKVLVNSAAAGAIKAYAKATAIETKPYLEARGPLTQAEPTTATVNIVLVNSDTTVNNGSIQLKFDGAVVTPVITPNSPGPGKVRVAYNPGVMASSSRHTVEFSFQDSVGTAFSKSWTFIVAGEITMRYFPLGINDGGLAKLKNSYEYINNAPGIWSNAPVIEMDDGSVGWGADYLGYFSPLETGNYTFYISADDNAELWLSTDENPANAVVIAREPSWSNFREWLTRQGGGITDGSEKRSQPMALEAGKRYFIHALASQGGGGGNLAVTWRGPSDPPVVGGEAAKSGGLTPLTGPAVGATPTTIVVNQGRPFGITGLAFAQSAALTSYQWLRNGSPIPDATSINFKRDAAAISDGGVYTLRVTISPSTGGADQVASSLPVNVTVNADTMAPVPVAGAITKQNGTVQVGVSFGSDLVDRATLVQGNFTFAGGTVSNFRVVSNSYNTYLSVVADMAGLAPGASGSVTVAGVKDIFGNTTASTVVPFTLTPFKWAEVGTPKAKGQVIPVGANGFDVVTGGRGYWGNYDEIDMAYMTKTGDFDVSVQVIEAEPSTRWSRAGLAVRNDLNVGMARPVDVPSVASAYAEIHANPNQTLAATWDPMDPIQVSNPDPNNSYESNTRHVTGGDTAGWQSGPSVAPDYPNVWLRLARTGTTIVGYRSLDGKAWIQMGTTTLDPFQSTVYVGPAHGIEAGNLWGGIYDVWADTYDPTYDRLFVAKYRNFGDTVLAVPGSLDIMSMNGTVSISWTGGGTLESATQLGASADWAPVAGVTGTNYTTTATGGARFFRLKQ